MADGACVNTVSASTVPSSAGVGVGVLGVRDKAEFLAVDIPELTSSTVEAFAS